MSEIRVDTISEKTSANGVAVDGVTLKDGKVTADAGIDIDNFNIDGTTIALSSGSITLDAAGRIDLSADDAGEIRLFDGSSMYGQFKDDDDRLKIQGLIQDKDIMIAGNDGGSEVTAVRFDMSEAGLAVFNAGVALGGAGTANTLDDYEEGTYAPTVTDENGGSYGLSTNSDTLQYTKIGRKVTLQGMLAVTSESSPNGTLRLSLPFTAPTLIDDSEFALYAMGISNNGSTIAGQKFLFVQAGAYAYLYAIGDDGATNYIGHDEVDTNFQFHVNLSYVVS